MRKVAFFILLIGITAAVTLSAQEQWWRITNREGGQPSRDNRVVLNRGDNFVYVLFRDTMPRPSFNRIRLNFTTDNDVTFLFYAANTPGQTWGAYREDKDRPITINHPGNAGIMSSGPVSSDLSFLTFTWADSTNETSLSKQNLNGLVLKIICAARTTFTMTEISFE